MKKFIALGVSLVILFCAGCSASGTSAITEGKLLEQLGKNKADTCAALGFEEKDLIELDGVYFADYRAPETIKVKYYGMDFLVHLDFDALDGRLWHVELTREYPGVSEDCAKDIVKIAKDLYAKNGKPKFEPNKGWGAHSIEDDEIPTLYEKIIKGMYSEGYIWYFVDSAPENMKQYIEDRGEGIFKHALCWEWDSEREIAILRIYWHLSGDTPNLDRQNN